MLLTRATLYNGWWTEKVSRRSSSLTLSESWHGSNSRMKFGEKKLKKQLETFRVLAVTCRLPTFILKLHPIVGWKEHCEVDNSTSNSCVMWVQWEFVQLCDALFLLFLLSRFYCLSYCIEGAPSNFELMLDNFLFQHFILFYCIHENSCQKC